MTSTPSLRSILAVAAACCWIPTMVVGQHRKPDDSLRRVYNQMSVDLPKSEYVIHDPSRIITIGNKQMIAVTGKAQEDGYNCGIETWWRKINGDGGDWRPGQCLFRTKPSWTAEETPENDGAYWAPELDYNEDKGTLTLLYSVSEMDAREGGPNTCVGVATPSNGLSGFPNKLSWTDIGEPVSCIIGSAYETEERSIIDPSVFWGFGKEHQNKLFMVTGGGRIIGTELDPSTYLQKNGEWFDLEKDYWTELSTGPNNEDDNWVEAAYIHPNPQTGYYYLFVNWGACCSGLDSTYEIRVGRSKNPMGPYVDQKGIDMMKGGGTLFQKKKSGYVIGPGHTAIWKKESTGVEYISYHYYDKRRGGTPWIAERRLKWNKNGWPRTVGRPLRTFPKNKKKQQ